MLQKHLVEAGCETSRSALCSDIATTAGNCWNPKQRRTGVMIAALLAYNTLCDAVVDQKQCRRRVLVCAQPRANPYIPTECNAAKLEAIKSAHKVFGAHIVDTYCNSVQQLHCVLWAQPDSAGS